LVAGRITAVPALKADYYELLGVERNADEQAIRKAYRSAAREVHPDVSDDPDSEVRFRELSEAYSVLSKKESRLLYDRFGYRGRGNVGFEETIWEERAPAARGESIYAAVELRAFEAEQGVSRVIRYQALQACTTCEGRGTKHAPDPDCADCDGSGRRRQVSHLEVGRLLHIDACPTCTGGPCSACDGTGRRRAERMLKVRIPAGVEDDAQLRVAGEGDAGEPGGIPGDLFLDVTVLPPPRDYRLVRYAALALFIAAVVLLVAYLLFR
jgi:molecular chaperone DnaJ